MVSMKRGYADTSAGQVHYVEGGSGPALLLLPQGGRSSRMYHALIEALASDFRVVAFDTPGTGGSLPLPERPVTIDEISDWVVEAIERIGIDRFDLFGLHGGGKIAASIAARHPERIRRFIYAGRSHSIQPSNAGFSGFLNAVPELAAVLAGNAGDPLPAWAEQYRAITEQWWGRGSITGMGDAAARRGIIAQIVDMLEAYADRPTFYRTVMDHDIAADLARITAPTLVIEVATAKEDRDVGRQGEKLVKLLHDGRLATIDADYADPPSLEDRAPELAKVLRDFLLAPA